MKNSTTIDLFMWCIAFAVSLWHIVRAIVKDEPVLYFLLVPLTAWSLTMLIRTAINMAVIAMKNQETPSEEA